MFNSCDDIERWLEPMTYEQFWEEVGPYNLTLQPRDHCEDQIARGLATEEVVLDVLKTMARIELQDILQLEWEGAFEPMALH